MPSIRAIGQNLIPLRRPQFVCPGEKRSSITRFNQKFTSLMQYHKYCHPQEEYLRHFTCNPSKSVVAVGYDFFGSFVEYSSVANRMQNDFIGTIADGARGMRICEVAAKHLENVFGRGYAHSDYVFALDGSMPECVNKGRIFWDVDNERIVIFTAEGFTLALDGTNIVEAAVYLPAIYAHIKEKIKTIPEGVNIVEAVIEGRANREHWSIAASPLHIRLSLRNLYETSPYQAGSASQSALDKALHNRLK